MSELNSSDTALMRSPDAQSGHAAAGLTNPCAAKATTVTSIAKRRIELCRSLPAFLSGEIGVERHGREIHKSCEHCDSRPACTISAQTGLEQGESEPESAGQSESQSADHFTIEVKDGRWQQAQSLKLRQKVPLRLYARRCRSKRIRLLAQFRRINRRDNKQRCEGNRPDHNVAQKVVGEKLNVTAESNSVFFKRWRETHAKLLHQQQVKQDHAAGKG